MATNVIPTTGLEYTIVPDGTPLGAEIGGPNTAYPYPGSQTPYSFTGTAIGYGDDAPPLNGYRILTRYKIVTYIPGTPSNPGDPNAVPPVPSSPGSDPSYSYVYSTWNLISQTMTCTSHAIDTPGNPFIDNTVDAQYISPAPGVYSESSSGITDGMKYDYFKVFDQSEFDHIPPLSTYDAPPEENVRIPQIPWAPDADPPLFPIDAVTSFVPDEREQVTVTYSLTTVWSGGTDVITISQVVTQNQKDWKKILKEVIDRSYYTHNLNPWKPDDRDPPDPTPGITTDGAPYYPGYVRYP